MKTIAIGIFALFLSACSTQQSIASKNYKQQMTTPQAEEPVRKDDWITFSKGYCFGKCPVYTLTIFKDGSMLYEGKANVERLGFYTAQLSKEQVKELQEGIKTYKILDSKEDLVDKMLMDAPTYKLKVVTKEVTKDITHLGPTPQNIRTFEKQIDDMLLLIDFKKISE